MGRSPVALLFTMSLLLLSVLSCSKEEKSAPGAKARMVVAPSGRREPAPPARGTAADALALEPIPSEAISGELNRDTKPGLLTLPASLARRTGDLDQMLKKHTIRALLLINPIFFFYQNGKPHGISYETLEELERFVNQNFNTGNLKVEVQYIPLRPDELGPALTEGVGDFIGQGIVITPGRQERYAFTTPIIKDVSEIIVTGKELANVESFDDLAGKDIYVNPLTVSYDNLKKISQERLKAGKAALSVHLGRPWTACRATTNSSGFGCPQTACSPPTSDRS